MSIKSLLLILFLYVCLVWVGALLYEPSDIRVFGLRWTAIGLIAVIGWIILSWLWGWVRIARARSAAKPKSGAKPATPVVSLHEDDAALLALLQEARIALAKSITGSEARFSSLPLYLLVGPEGAGKTSALLNSGLEPVSLSGQPTGAGQVIPTRIGNVWLARNALFIELGGRAFSGDLGRWASLLRTLRGGSQLSRWQRLFKESDAGLNLRGILAFGDVKEFMGALSPQGREKLDRLSSLWHERLSAITEVFGRQFPVYWITTKTDGVPYFADYFGRLRGTELGQIFGCTLPFAPPDARNPESVSAQAENKRLTKSTSPLLHRLAERRVVHLAREEDPARKPGIYEFPREMRRIRPTVVQFLVDVFRPHPLRHTPFLRGYYFTGTCEEQIAFAETASRAPSSEESGVFDASAVFQGDATQVFKKADQARQAAMPARSGRPGFTRRWAFIPELITGVVLPDTVMPQAPVSALDPQVELYRKAACGAVCFICLLLCLCFLRSWVGNSHLLDSINNAETAPTRAPTVEDLKALDKLHDQALQLLDYERNGPPWRLRWGLYSGKDLVTPARDLYFRRFGEMLLRGLNDAMVGKLKSVPATAGVDDPNYGAVSTLLKTHLMITSGACQPEPAFVSRVLKQTLDETNPASTSEWRQLAGRQIDFYANELPSGNPVHLVPDADAVDHARGYLSSIQGADRLYAALLTEAEKRFPAPQSLAALASNYPKVLNGPVEVSGVFTPDGWNYLKSASKDLKTNLPGRSCIDEQKGLITSYQQDADVERKIQQAFARDYIDRWQKFVNGFSVVRFSGAADAARKLEILSQHNSPLLALFALTSKNTYFPASAPSLIDKSESLIDKTKEKLGLKNDSVPDLKQTDSATGIINAFQPVQSVVPPVSDVWVTDKNLAYVDALAQLGQSMDQIAHNTTSDPAVYQAAAQNYLKALAAARQLEEHLSPNTNGLDTTVVRLLEQPIDQAHALIPTPVDPAQKVNGTARAFCNSIAGTLRKFPFQPSTVDVSLDEFSRLFAPGSGSIWKFQADALADSVVKDGAQWKAKDGAKLPPTGEMINFLNRAQAITDAFFPKGSSQPQFFYTLRPKLDPAYQNAFVHLEVDGQVFEWTNAVQHQFSWPAASGGTGGAVGRVKIGAVSVPFASRGGAWALFHILRDAEPRLPGSKIVEWKNLRGGDGRLDSLSVPVRLEFVDFPNGADVFHPKFFDNLQCGGKAVQQLQ